MRSGSGSSWKTRDGGVRMRRAPSRQPGGVAAHRAQLAVAPAGAARRAAPAGRVRRYLACLRYREILMLQGSPLLGAAYAMGAASVGRLAALALFAAAHLLLVAHVFVLNDSARVEGGLHDVNKVAGVVAAEGISPGAVRRPRLRL